ncbi:MAG TPA: hypothetical protein DCR93_03010 [Cytophagales bacterium]|nr:hypothetical protein [Cytophagales bacterium]HAP58513.1 hypothetical protein [Cytophagales bacterium]
MKKLYTLIVLLGLSNILFAQQDPHFTQYMFNYMNYNPAAAGTEGVTKVNLAYRNQWTGYQPTINNGVSGGAPQTQFIGISAPLLTQRMGIGFQVVNDRLGTMNRLDFLVNASYQIDIAKNKLSIGARTGFISRGFDLRNLVFADPEDPVAQEESLAEVRPELGLGLYWRAKNYYAGVSFNHLLTNENLAIGGVTFRTPLTTHAYGFVGYEQEILNSWIISPSIMVKTDLNTYSFDVGVVASSDDKLYAGVTWRESEAINLLVGYNVFDGAKKLNSQWLRVSYSFDFVITERQAKQATSHEIMLSYILPNPKSSEYRPERTPRFPTGG